MTEVFLYKCRTCGRVDPDSRLRAADATAWACECGATDHERVEYVEIDPAFLAIHDAGSIDK